MNTINQPAKKAQSLMNKKIAKKINSDEKTAFMYASNVKRLLTVPVTDKLFISLVKLCEKMSSARFSDSLVLKMVNYKAGKKDIDNIITMTLNNYSRY